MKKLFVYGTLRKGASNPATNYGGEYVGSTSVTGFKMFDLGSFPGIRHTGNREDVVNGDVFEVSEDILARMDRYEGYDADRPASSLYIRLNDVPTVEDEAVMLYEYNGEVPEQYQIASGDWFKREG